MLYRPNIPDIPQRVPFALKVERGLLLRSTNWLGDALMTLPAAYQASRILPKGGVYSVLCPNFLRPLWEACPWVDQVIPLQGKHCSSQERQQIKALQPDLALVFPNSFGSAWDVCRCGIPQRVGRAGRWRRLLLSHSIPEWPRAHTTGDRHQLFYYLELLSALTQVTASTEYPELKVDLQRAADLGIQGDGWLALAPGAAFGPAKQWPAEHFKTVAQAHIRQGGRVVFVGTGKERRVTAALSQQLPGSVDLAGRTDLAQLMAVLKAAGKVLANDSGAMHLAAAVGSSGVAVFGSTDPIATGPIGAPWRYIASRRPCRPCFQRHCPLKEACAEGTAPCLEEISPEQVLNELALLPATDAPRQ